MAAIVGRARPTRGFLIELKKRVAFVKEGYKLLELKREELAKTVRTYLDLLEAKRADFDEKVERALSMMRTVYAFLGSGELESQADAAVGGLVVQIYPKSVMGCIVPYVKEVTRVEAKLGLVTRSIMKEFSGLLDDLVRMAEVEASIERIAVELEATNRKVNALEKVVIPELERSVKYIADMLDEEMLEEVVRTKIIRDAVARRRG